MNMSELRYPNESKEYRAAARSISQRRTGAYRQSEISCRKTPQAPTRRGAKGGLRVPVGQRWESWKEREIFRTVCGQEHGAAVFMDVRPKLGQARAVQRSLNAFV